MKIVCYYNKNLKMSQGKIASQIGHVCMQVALEMNSYRGGVLIEDKVVVVLGLRQNKFKEKLKEIEKSENLYYIQKDLGITEVNKGIVTAFGYISHD